MNVKKVLLGLAGIAALAAVGAYALIAVLITDEDEPDDIDMEVEEAFVEAYFCPELISLGD